MKPFDYLRATTPTDAITAMAQAGTLAIAGGTNLVDLMKLQVEVPSRLVDITRLDLANITERDGGLHIGALVSNTDVAVHPRIRADYPVLARAILAGATQQLRNKASVGGNLGQRTRCPYFTNIDQPCNKRAPGSGCGAIAGVSRIHAILGASKQCIATYPGDMAIALSVLDAQVEVRRADGSTHCVPARAFHRLPGDRPERDNVLDAGDLITGVRLPEPVGGKQLYRKVRERSSYAFALCSVAAIVATRDGRITRADLAFGSIAHKPWTDERLSALLIGEKPAIPLFDKAADVLLDSAQGYGENDFKIPLLRRTLVATLCDATGISA